MKGNEMLRAEVMLIAKSYHEAHCVKSVPYEKGNELLIKLIEEMADLGYELVDAGVNFRRADGMKVTIAIDDGEWKE